MFFGRAAPTPMSMEKWKGKWIEMLVVLAVILAVAVPVLRLNYGDAIRQRERALFEWLGINPAVGYGICGVLASALVYFRYRRSADRGK